MKTRHWLVLGLTVALTAGALTAATALAQDPEAMRDEARRLMEEAEHLCGRIAIMDHGKIIAEGSPQDLILEYAPEPPEARLHGNLEDVFLRLTGHALRE